jgi:hypothetical protein
MSFVTLVCPAGCRVEASQSSKLFYRRDGGILPVRAELVGPAKDCYAVPSDATTIFAAAVCGQGAVDGVNLALATSPALPRVVHLGHWPESAEVTDGCGLGGGGVLPADAYHYFVFALKVGTIDPHMMKGNDLRDLYKDYVLPPDVMADVFDIRVGLIYRDLLREKFGEECGAGCISKLEGELPEGVVKRWKTAIEAEERKDEIRRLLEAQAADSGRGDAGSDDALRLLGDKSRDALHIEFEVEREVLTKVKIDPGAGGYKTLPCEGAASACRSRYEDALKSMRKLDGKKLPALAPK